MAMVFQSERNFEFNKGNDSSNIGPGRYFPNFNSNKIEPNKQPFLTGAPRQTQKENDTPGPGAYYQDEERIKYLRNINNEKISIQNDNINLISKIGMSYYDILNSNDKKGFNIKSKRFKIINTNNSSPGPGQYFIEKKHNTKEKLDKVKESKLFSKKKLKFIKNTEYQHIPTIPSKEFRYGFDLSQNGNLIKRKNPDMYKTFTGEKGDTVGPGSYELEKPNDWLKTGTSWSKLKTIRDCYKTNSSCMTTTYNSESKKSNIIDNSSIKLGSDDGIINMQISQHSDYKSNSNSTKNISKKKDIFNCRIKNCKNVNSKKVSMEKNFENVIKRYVPGPGYYFDEKMPSSFNIKSIPEYKQFFGSKTKRFQKIITNTNDNNKKLGPGCYFHNKKKSNKSSPVIFVPFSTTTERFNEKPNNDLGPGEYDIPINEVKKSMSNSVDKKFGSTTMRFDEILESKWKNSVPGPGYYNPINKEINIDNNLDKNKDLKNVEKGHLLTMTKKDCENYKANINNLKNIQNENKISPPIGLYNPDIVYSIDYNNKKKVYENNNVKTAFSRTVYKTKKKKNISTYYPSSNLGPGYYYKEQKIKNTQIFPPFHQSDKRKDWVTSYSQKVGPGSYNPDTFNDWNKKSFNINYV